MSRAIAGRCGGGAHVRQRGDRRVRDVERGLQAMTKPKTFLTALFALLLAARVLALDIYVATNGTGSGTSWADATNSLAGAIAYVETGQDLPENGTIWLSNGVYTGISEVILEYTAEIKGITGNPADVIIAGDGATFMFDCATAGNNLTSLTITNGGGAAPLTLVDINNCVIAGNSGSQCGGLRAGSASRCVFVGNSSSEGAGAAAGAASLYNCLIINNTGDTAGAVDDATLYNCTVSGNSGTIGGMKTAIAYNTISYGNIGDPDDMWAEYYSCGSGYTGTGSITNDPLFIGSGDYRLQAGSPCINAGTNSTWTTLTDTDLDGNLRRWPANGQADMGAYEFGSGTVYRKKVFFMKTE